MHESIVFCSTCTMSSSRKFTFAISSSDEFLVIYVYVYIGLGKTVVIVLKRLSASYENHRASGRARRRKVFAN